MNNDETQSINDKYKIYSKIGNLIKIVVILFFYKG